MKCFLETEEVITEMTLVIFSQSLKNVFVVFKSLCIKPSLKVSFPKLVRTSRILQFFRLLLFCLYIQRRAGIWKESNFKIQLINY